ncbi:MAG: RecX family transcriptional regulator [Alphaproteobacteria bacterium]|nr:RecX family transcriptional regulator [Alphaproteobacteria bacterium]
MSDASSRGRQRPARRGPRRVTAEYLERAGLHYLERYATSTANFRRVLMRKVERAARFYGDDPAAGAAMVEALVARYLAAGLLDDRAYAEGRARSLHGRGESARSIRGKLLQKGVAADDIETALSTIVEEEGAEDREGLDMRAACAFARRRRIGPYRVRSPGPEQREKDLAALGRAGFDYDIARKVVEAESIETLEADATRR